MKRMDGKKMESKHKKKNNEGEFVSETQGEEIRSGAILQLVEIGSEAEGNVEVTRIEEEVVEQEEEAVFQHEEAVVQEEKEASIEFVGESFDPREIFGVLALVDVTSKVRKVRKIPAFHHVDKPVTRIGNSKRADFKVDDFESVRREHGAIVFKNGQFYVYPQNGLVIVNGKGVSAKGELLENGSQIEMGSAKFLFLRV